MTNKYVKTWVLELHKHVVSVGLRTAQLDTHITFWMLSSLFATLLSIPLRSYEELKSGKQLHFEDVVFFLLNSGVIFHFLSIKKQPTNISALTEFLLKPFKSYPPESPHKLVVYNYYRKFAIIWILTIANLVLTVLGQCLSPLVTVLWISVDLDLHDRPLPLGRTILLWKNVWAYWFCYFVSVISILTCAIIHCCWFGTFMCSTLLVVTKLDLLALEFNNLTERVRLSYEEDLRRYRSLSKFKYVRNKVWFRVTKIYIKEVVDEHTNIIQKVQLLDSTYRWIILVYIEITVLASALIVTLSISEWSSDSNKGLLRLDVLIACLFFAFLNNLCGQTVIDKFEKLRLCLYNVNWMDQPLSFQRSLLIMMTVSNRPPCLTAGSVIRLSLASFKRVMEAMYSYINVLITVRKLDIK